MEPITTTILTALAAGASAAAKDMAGSAIKDAYQGLKKAIQRRLAGQPNADLVLAEHEKRPEVWNKPMEEALIQAGADSDQEIVHQAQAVLKLLSDVKHGGQQVHGSGAAADRGGVAAGQGGIAAGRDVAIGSGGRDKEVKGERP
jgi:hypothetical protein